MRSSSRGDVDPFIVMDVMEQARRLEQAGRSIIHMEVGQPGTPAPKAARAALAQAMEQEALGYTVALGLPELREGIARLYADWYGVQVSPERVVVTAGSSAAFVLAFTALFEAGEAVGVTEPGYPSYRQILKSLSLTSWPIPTHAKDRHVPKMPNEKLAGLIVASPANPTGTMLSKDDLGQLISACQKQGTAFISDEIYHGVQYEGRAVSALELSDDVYVINSFSKYFSMTGWRLGWMIVPEDHVRRIERLAQNMFICAPHAAQIAALGALGARDETEAMLAVYRENRRLMLEGLPQAGFNKIAPPDGAFYIYADVSDLTQDSLAFAAEILEQAGVAVTPGLDFDPVRGHTTLRFSYARSTADIAEGLDRLKRFMAERK
ncbi:pyridoxal phosphate-dependent aminotransferase [Litoreibacter janthinus]|uniref:Aminotransferase n=1 Tax=Litoreibacter janthinus TaxID=670154 RepID=A0A1I6H0V4_9RHOB|nr:aminotransferase class I/II-fold pyridoxal phosphate-dependent enzyme [Litoreibacter janthinus]SFR48083.1 Aspartate/methionine/tyrosine aminotransferase [Litoreibacter janthinus]